jgi:hypothetical protein
MRSRCRPNQGPALMVSRCPEPSDLLLYAMPMSDSRLTPIVAQHVSQCASCRAIVADLRDVSELLQSPDGEDVEPGDCLDDMTVAMVAEQGANVSERARVIAHLAACARCREQVASVARLLRAPAVVAEIRRRDVSAPSVARWRHVAGAGALAALAASLVLMTGVGDRASVTRRSASAGNEPAHREQSVTTTVAPSVIAPVGAVAVADTFRWSGVPHADRYRLTLFDRDGTVVWETQATDTATIRPRSIAFEPSAAYLWKVEARTGWDRWVESDLIEFSVAPNKRSP